LSFHTCCTIKRLSGRVVGWRYRTSPLVINYDNFRKHPTFRHYSRKDVEHLKHNKGWNTFAPIGMDFDYEEEEKTNTD